MIARPSRDTAGKVLQYLKRKWYHRRYTRVKKSLFH